MTYDMNYYTERLRCTEEEKLECLETVRQLAGINEVARKDGLLSLEDYAKRIDDPFFRECLQYIIDAYGPDEVREAFERMLIAGDYHGKEFLRHLLIAQGVLAIQAGNSTDGLIFHLSSWMGAGWQKVVADTVHQESDRIRKPERCLFSICPDFDRLMELPVERRDALARDLWESTRPVDKPDLLLSLKHAGDSVKDYLLEGLTPSQREDVREALDSTYVRWTGKEKSEEAQKRVMERLEADDGGSRA